MKGCAWGRCKLTALWQVGLTFTPRWSDEIEPILAWTSMCVCGMCIDDVTVDALGDAPERMAASMTDGHPDAVRIEVRREDISDGLWMDPAQRGKRVPT